MLRGWTPIARLHEYFSPNARALDITPDVVSRYVGHRLDDEAAPATVKNELAALGRGFTLAYRAGLLAQRPSLPTVRVNNVRRGFFSEEDVQRVLHYLPDYMRPFVEAAYLTGWRRGEMRSLRWSQVDSESGTIRLERGTTKSGEPRSFPFTAHPRLEALLCEQREATAAFEKTTGSVCPWVFHRDGHQVTWYYDGWRNACRKAGLPGRLFHDLRRSAVRNLVRAGVSERVAMTLTGHKTRSVFDRYHIVDGSDQVEAVRKLAALQGATKPGMKRRAASLGDFSEGTRTEPAQFRRSRALSRSQLIVPPRGSAVSPTGFEPVFPP